MCQKDFSGQRPKRNNQYCSAKCNGAVKRLAKIESWLSGEWDGSANRDGELAIPIKTYLKEKAGFQCTLCGWDKINPITGKCPLDVDHIDGNSSNNHPSNLQVICPNCHSLTPTYKALNMGKGRASSRGYRKQYNQFLLKDKEIIFGPKNKPKRHPGSNPKDCCDCGNEKSFTSKQCQTCHFNDVRANMNYPPIDIMLAEIAKVGCAPYAKTLGKTDSAVKKHLLKNDVNISEIRRQRGTGVCHCGEVIHLSPRGALAKTCLTHRIKKIEYPPIDDMIAGIQEKGWAGYARSIDVKHASNIRKFLVRNGVDVNSLKKE